VGLFNRANKSKTGTNKQLIQDGLFNKSNLSNSNGLYLDYDESLLTRAKDGNVVLFFHANWCSSCKALDSGLKNDLENFPEDLTILKLNYDKESELKKKYGVVIQHTLVQVDSEGNEITKWTGGNDLESVLRRLK